MHARGMHARELQINHKRPHAVFRDLSLQKLVFHNSDLSKSTTVYKMGDLEGSPKSFWIWKHIHVHKEHVYEVYAHEVHA
jgi:hypothetical protein